MPVTFREDNVSRLCCNLIRQILIVWSSDADFPRSRAVSRNKSIESTWVCRPGRSQNHPGHCTLPLDLFHQMHTDRGWLYFCPQQHPEGRQLCKKGNLAFQYCACMFDNQSRDKIFFLKPFRTLKRQLRLPVDSRVLVVVSAIVSHTGDKRSRLTCSFFSSLFYLLV